ncbi:Lipoprotein-releasing system ATP-binding protein LolD [hydrothermal vent metagenome]|uniref:Lipoprotein-releasing system ATP-binding protein LolD n=1 Tax=hydrothermal vent metagenome TaxID=652676 RepID=A0A3B0T671_9ZZZZ
MSKKARTGAALELIDVARTYYQGEVRLDVFTDASLTLAAGEIVGLVGQSGSGKSSLLHIAGLLDTADDGEVYIGGRSVAGMSDTMRACTRRDDIGFVYQFHHLLPEFTALENVAMPQLIAGASKTDAAVRATNLLETLKLGDRLTHRPGQLSGGEQQRVAIARAVANRPRVLLADEPTGNLDPTSAELVFSEFLNLARSEGLAALIATHNFALADRMDRVLVVEGGRVRSA